MIQAELHGKLFEIENSEDVLTSNIFGLLKYLPNDVFLNILDHAKTLSGEKIEFDLKSYIPEFIFWENIKGYGEPDLIIKFRNKVGHELILCIEIKYYSSKSGEGDNDQLKRYFEALSISSKEKSRFLGVVYLTKYPSRKELEDSLYHIEQKELDDAEEKLFQLRWFEITESLENYNGVLNRRENLILNDLIKYLKYKNFVEFTGFSFQSKDFNISPDQFYVLDHQEFEGFSFLQDLNIGVNEKITYGDKYKMTDEEKKLEYAFQYIKTFYREVALMLEAIQELMDKEGWTSMGDSRVTSDLSKSLDNPDYWLSYYLYKNFTNNDVGNYKKGILVFFDIENNEFPISIVYGNVNSSNQQHETWDIWRLWYNNKDKLKSLTGEIIPVKTEHKGKKIDGKLIAIPLTMISTKECLKEKVVDKLLNLE